MTITIDEKGYVRGERFTYGLIRDRTVECMACHWTWPPRGEGPKPKRLLIEALRDHWRGVEE